MQVTRLYASLAQKKLYMPQKYCVSQIEVLNAGQILWAHVHIGRNIHI